MQKLCSTPLSIGWSGTELPWSLCHICKTTLLQDKANFGQDQSCNQRPFCDQCHVNSTKFFCPSTGKVKRFDSWLLATLFAIRLDAIASRLEAKKVSRSASACVLVSSLEEQQFARLSGEGSMALITRNRRRLSVTLKPSLFLGSLPGCG